MEFKSATITNITIDLKEVFRAKCEYQYLLGRLHQYLDDRFANCDKEIDYLDIEEDTTKEEIDYMIKDQLLQEIEDAICLDMDIFEITELEYEIND